MEENKVAQMTKHTDTSRSTDCDSSAPNSPELTRLSGEQAEERTAREGRERAEAQLLDDLGLSFHRVGNALQVTLFDPFKIESLVPADKSYTAHFAMDKVWKKLIEMRVAANNAAENSPALPETTNSPTKPQACASCSRLASRVEELENLLAKHSGSLNSADSASNTESSSAAKEIW